MLRLAKADVPWKKQIQNTEIQKQNNEQENVWNIAVHEMLRLAKTDVAWNRRANQFQLSVQQIYNTEIQFRVRGKFSLKRSFTLSRPVITKQKLGPEGELIVHGLNLPCKNCTIAHELWFGFLL